MKHVHLIGLPRSGTTYFARVIQEYYSPKSVADVKGIRLDLNEPFREDDAEDTDSVVQRYDNILNQLKQSKYPLTIKSHYCHLHSISKHNYMQEIDQLNFYNIGLVRKDIWETSMSLAIANYKNQWFDYDTDRFKMDVDFYDTWLKNCLGALTEFKQNKCNIDFNEIVFYEDLSLNPRTDFSNLKLCNQSFNSLHTVKLFKTFKAAPRKTDIVLNYNQIRDYYCKAVLEYVQNYDYLTWIKLDDQLKIKSESYK